MSVTDETEKKFVINHVFKDLKNAGKYLLGDTVTHFNIPWRVYAYCKNEIKLECLKLDDGWSVDFDTDVKLPNKPDVCISMKNLKFPNTRNRQLLWDAGNNLDEYLVDGNLTVEVHVKINNITGIRENFDFAGTKAQEKSDAVLKIGDQKFYVCKMFLSLHSTYFESLFSGNFSESEKSEIELKDIDTEHFQNFLELIYGFSDVTEESCAGILKLADMYDAKAATERCEDFLISRSKKSLKRKFDAAMEYNLNDLTKKCISEMKTRADVRLVLPVEPDRIQNSMWKELIEKSLSMP